MKYWLLSAVLCTVSGLRLRDPNHVVEFPKHRPGIRREKSSDHFPDIRDDHEVADPQSLNPYE